MLLHAFVGFGMLETSSMMIAKSCLFHHADARLSILWDHDLVDAGVEGCWI
jgi:hypothetical protein